MIQNILENFRFLVIEVQNQVRLTRELLYRYDEKLLDKIASKDDYIDNLKTTVENACFYTTHRGAEPPEEEVRNLRAIHVMTVNLERIADFCVNIGRQTQHLHDKEFLDNFHYGDMIDLIEKGIDRVLPVYTSRQLSGALDVCRIEFDLDRLYKANFDHIMGRLHMGRDVGDLVTALFIFRYLERVGDAILNVGEALIFVILGERIKINQFEALEKTLTDSGFKGTLSDIQFRSIWGSRSGCRISTVKSDLGGFKAQGIFKEGAKPKIRRERENLMRWEEIAPGLTPRIFGYHEKTEIASLLIEFLPGCNLDQVILTGDDEVLKNAVFILESTIQDIWAATLKKRTVTTDFMHQLSQRLSDVMDVHPGFKREERRIGSAVALSTMELINRCAEIEKDLPAPFEVWIHGDFNINNIVYDHDAQKVHYIDLYRSRAADYVQDASVFLVSNFRMPIFDPAIRERINMVIDYFFNMFSRFASANGDTLFEARMAPALARSFLTSTRFELNEDFAAQMAMRSHYLMERVVAFGDKDRAAFRLPRNVLFYQP